MGVGAVLYQHSATDGKVHPCAFFSHHLSPAERNYDVGNCELLAIRLALGEWGQWLEGSSIPFIVWTDHRNLEYIRSTKRLNARQARWALFFTHRFLGIDFSISYRPGSKNIKPDALSRLFDSSTSTPGGYRSLRPGCERDRLWNRKPLVCGAHSLLSVNAFGGLLWNATRTASSPLVLPRQKILPLSVCFGPCLYPLVRGPISVLILSLVSPLRLVIPSS